MPDGQVATQLVPFSSGVADVAEQVVHRLLPAPLQVAHVLAQAWHAVPSE